LYWLQTEAPRADGGQGWPGLRPRGDIVGTQDGLAMRPYIRESRRIVAECTVREQDIALAVRGSHGATRYVDSVGTGYYRIDLHPSTEGDNFIDIPSCPFELPLGALLPVRVANLLPGAKNIGTTHITNGCYRTHPVEWLVGEVAGTLAAHADAEGLPPRAIRRRFGSCGSIQARSRRDSRHGARPGSPDRRGDPVGAGPCRPVWSDASHDPKRGRRSRS
jgi:hypothetical protein